jgi:putative FmdB family regulatory protein
MVVVFLSEPPSGAGVMPTYTYQCPQCEQKMDVYHGMNDSPKVKCPDCKKVAKRLLGTGSGLIFKGSGFYETDYKRDKKGGNGSSKPSESSESKSETKSEAKSESKPAAAAESKSETKSSAKSEAKK